MSLITKAHWQTRMDNLKPLMQRAKAVRAETKANFIAAKAVITDLKTQVLECKKALKEDLDFPE